MAAAANASGGASVVSVGNSALFDSANSESLSRTFDASNRRTWTFSTWLYRGLQGTNQNILYAVSGGLYTEIRIQDDDKFRVYLNNGGSAGDLKSSALLRDIGWYHLIIALDTTQAVASNRCIMYINGERVTDFTTENYPTLNLEVTVNTATSHSISGNPYLNAYLAETVFIDGSQLAPTSFGAYDTSGLYWTPLSSTTIKALTFGTNGFYLDNTTNAQTDASGEGNNWTNNNTVVTTTHSPTNSAALLNPLNLYVGSGAPVISQGNTRVTSSAATGYNSGALTTIPMGAGGKYYFEVYVEGLVANAVPYGISLGISPFNLPRNFDSYTTVPGKSVYEGGTIDFQGSGYSFLQANAGAQNVNIAPYAPSVGQYVQCAFDSSNGKIWYGINNTWHGSGNPSTGANPDSTLDVVTTWYGWVGCYTTAAKAVMNFGSSAYQYTPPTGFGAVTTTTITDNTTRTASDVTKYFQTVLYEGSGAGQRVGAFQPFDNAFTVGNGALFAVENNEYLKRTNSSAGSLVKWTYSTWCKRNVLGTTQVFFGTNAPAISTALQVNSGTDLVGFNLYNGNYYSGGGSYVMQLTSTEALKDTSQWIHVVAKYDSTPSSPSAASIGVYINGVQLTMTGSYPSQNQVTGWNSAAEMLIGGVYNANPTVQNLAAYQAETVFIDGQALEPSSFGQTDTSTNRWIPKDVSGLTFGTNGFYLNYASSGDVGNDVSGNNNDWTNVNTVTQTTDSPTTNFAVINPIPTVSQTLSVGNTRATGAAASAWRSRRATISAPSGKFYAEWECQSNFTGAGGGTAIASVVDDNSSIYPGVDTNSVGVYSSTGGDVYVGLAGATDVDTGLNTAADDRILACFDVESGKAWAGFYDANTTTTYWYKNTGATGADPAAGTFPTYVFPPNTPLTFMTTTYNTQVIDFFAESSNFTLTPPTGFSALAQDNLASTDQFISAFSWIKNRDATDNHMLFDRVRGVTKDIHSNVTDAQVTNANTLQSFLSAGVQIGDDVEVNTANESYVLWNWMMEATGSGSSNEDGSINTTSTLVDTTLGMSISTYTGTGSAATIGHGLGVTPQMIIVKKTSGTGLWATYHSGMDATAPEDYYVALDATTARQDYSAYWNDTAPTSSLFTIGTDGGVNASSGNYVAYCFAPSQFISIGSYEGNGSTDGTFVPTFNSLGIPIQPVFWIVKNIDTATNWIMSDTARNPYNKADICSFPNLTNAEGSEANVDVVTGGLKYREAANPTNNGYTYVYIAVGIPIIDTDGRIIAGF